MGGTPDLWVANFATVSCLSLRLPAKAGAQQPYWVSSEIGPWFILLDDGVCDNEEFSHGGGDGDFGRFASRAEVLVGGAGRSRGWLD